MAHKLYSNDRLGNTIFIFILFVFLFRNVFLGITEMAVGLSWAAVCPVSATVWLMSAKTRQGGAW